MEKYQKYCLSKDQMQQFLYPLDAKNLQFRSTEESKLQLSAVNNFANKILALDCEMVRTDFGLELARITVINFNCDVLMDEFVKPTNPIRDYNTQFSGITELTLRRVTTRLADIQDKLLQIVCPDTILIGHSLENDLVALKVLLFWVWEGGRRL